MFIFLPFHLKIFQLKWKLISPFFVLRSQYYRFSIWIQEIYQFRAQFAAFTIGVWETGFARWCQIKKCRITKYKNIRMNKFQTYKQNLYCMLGNLQTNFEFEEHIHYLCTSSFSPPSSVQVPLGCTGDWELRQTSTSCTHGHPDTDTFPFTGVGTASCTAMECDQVSGWQLCWGGSRVNQRAAWVSGADPLWRRAHTLGVNTTCPERCQD